MHTLMFVYLFSAWCEKRCLIMSCSLDSHSEQPFTRVHPLCLTRRILNHASDTFLSHLPIHYLLTVRCPNPQPDDAGRLATKGLFFGNDIACFNAAAELSLKVNFIIVDKPLHKVRVFVFDVGCGIVWAQNVRRCWMLQTT